MIDPGRVSIVIPAFDEELGLGPVVERVVALRPWCEVLVLDDGSRDRTAEAAAAAGARVVRHPYNKKRHPQVEKFSLAPPQQGGGGATIVELKK